MAEYGLVNVTEDDEFCKSNFTIVLLFINFTNPGYFKHRLNDIVILLTLAGLGIILNSLMAGILLRSGEYKQSANAFLSLQLFIADLLVAFFCLTSDGIWNITMQWLAGNAVCRMVKFTQMFSLYATTLILTGMTVERCITVTFPISKSSRTDSIRRSRFISLFVWSFAGICSIPQAVIFHVERAPICPDFHQCVTHGFYSDPTQELFYTMTTLCLMFIIPLVIILICFTIIFASFSREAQQALGENGNTGELSHLNQQQNGKKRGQRLYVKARRISLWMTMVIALAFVVCWTPYYILMFAHLFDWIIPVETISSLFCFGMSNSVLNPIIFGAFRWMSKSAVGRKATLNGTITNENVTNVVTLAHFRRS